MMADNRRVRPVSDYEPTQLDSANQLLRCQALIVKDCLNTSEDLRRENDQLKTELHWFKRELADARACALARQQAPGAAGVASERSYGLPGSTGTPPEPEELIRPYAGDEALEFPAAVDMGP